MTENQGNCFEVAANTVVAMLYGEAMLGDDFTDDVARNLEMVRDIGVEADDIYVVHSWVTRQHDGRVHEHAWLEYEQEFPPHPNIPPTSIQMVVDCSNGTNNNLPAVIYHKVGKATLIGKWSARDTLEKMVTVGHYGPWMEE